VSQSVGVLVSGSSYTLSSYQLRDAVESGGTLVVVAGGTADETSVLAGGTVIVQSGGSAQSDLVENGAIIVSAGGFASNTGLSGALTVSAQGTAEGGFVQGGNIQIDAGGTGGGFSIDGGVETVSSGGQDSGSLLDLGSITVLAGGTAINEDVTPNGAVLVESGGLALAEMNGNLPGSAIGVTLLSGANMEVSSGGVAQGDLVDSGASMTVGSGGKAELAVVSGGAVTVGPQGAESASTLLAGASETVSGGGTAIGTIFGLASPSVPGGTMTVISGGIASATEFVNGGTILVDGGGTLIDPVNNSSTPGHIDINSGGVLSVTAGASTFGISLDAGGSLDIAAGGVVALMDAVGATVDVGNQAGLGLAQASAGGSIIVAAGGSSEFLVAGIGGDVTVQSGGTLVGAAVAGQGTLDIQSGATLLSGIAFSGYAADAIVGASNISGLALYGFGADNTLDLTGIAYAAGGTVGSSGSVLSFTENGQTYDIGIVSGGIGGHALTLAADASGGTMIEVACFAAGTRIATPAGEAAVEALRPGDAVLALIDGAWRPAPVRWVGRTTIDLARHPHPAQAAPVRIRADAVAPGLPRRDLLLSPDHALFLDGMLIQAQALVNGATVTQEVPGRVTYYHVELDRHAVLLADGLPAESYLDTGNRALFAGEAGRRALHPDLAGARAWDERACAPLVLSGPRLAAAHARLLLRAVELGHALTGDPGLRLLADGREIASVAAGPAWRAVLPAGTHTVRLCSASFVPAWFAEDDRRRLGVAVRTLRLGGRPLPRAAFARGWHAPEAAWRWTDGDAVLAIAPLTRPTRLTVELTQRGERYWRVPEGHGIPLAAGRVARA
jgi:autotransporter passenger strand-loop-strand repeat protein